MKTAFTSLILLWVVILTTQGQNQIQFNGLNYQKINGTWYQLGEDTFQLNLSKFTVRFNEGLSQQKVDSLNLTNQTSIIHVDKRGYTVLQIPVSANIFTVATTYRQSGLCQYVRLNTYGEYLGIPNDPDFIHQWYLNQGNGIDINAPEAWDLVTVDPNIVIAVIDAGVDWTHQDLGLGNDGYQHIYLNPGEDAWSDPNDPTTGNGIDDDNNGKIDDWKGWFFNGNTNDSRNLPSVNHGTIIAGIIAAKTDNNTGVAGIAGGLGAEGVKILPITLDKYTVVPDFSLLSGAIDYALEQGADIIQLSLKADRTLANEAALKAAHEQGVLVVCAAGNKGNLNGLNFPANNYYTLAVNGSNQNDEIWRFHVVNNTYWGSHAGPELDVAAPCIDIFSTKEDDTYGIALWMGMPAPGTSFAAPQVSGLAALLLSVNPNLSPDEIRAIICMTADKVGGYDYSFYPNRPGQSEYLGYGRIDLEAAVQFAANVTIKQDPVISGNTVWNNNLMVKGTLRIPGGARLTVQNSTVRFSRNSKVLVEPGGKLILDGATFTGLECARSMWQGIQVLGSPSKVQPDDPYASGNQQGFLHVKNSSIIEHAETAILAGFTKNKAILDEICFTVSLGIKICVPTIRIVQEKVGGSMVWINNDPGILTPNTIKNNRVGLHFYPYAPDNKSRIADFIFDCTDSLADVGKYEGQGVDAHIIMEGVKGVDLVRNTVFSNVLRNSNEIFKLHERGTGIRLINSGVHIFKPHLFEGLTKGIDAYSMGSLEDAVIIDQCTFDGVAQGITLNGNVFGTIQNNQFVVAPGDASTMETYGIFSENASGFLITENKFSAGFIPTHNISTYGVVINNSQGFGGEFYKNTYNSRFYVGTQVEGQNGELLQLGCNDYTQGSSASHDWAMPVGTTLGNQGICNKLSDGPAGNRFHPNRTLNSDIFNEGGHFTYNAHSLQEPLDYTKSNVSVTDCFVPFSEKNSCPSKIEPCEQQPCVLLPNGQIICHVNPYCQDNILSRLKSTKDPNEKMALTRSLLQISAKSLHTDQMDEALDFLELLGLMEADRILAATYLERKEFGKCKAALNRIPYTTQEDIAFHELYDMLVSACQEGRGLTELKYNEQAVVESVAHTTTNAGTYAQTLLVLLADTNYNRWPEPLRQTAHKRNQQEQDEFKLRESVGLTIFPNPANLQLNIQYSITVEASVANITIRDLLGRIIRRFPLTLENDYLSFSTRSLDPGMYLVQLTINGRPKVCEKVLIFR